MCTAGLRYDLWDWIAGKQLRPCGSELDFFFLVIVFFNGAWVQPGRAAGGPVAPHVDVAFALDPRWREAGDHLDGVLVEELVVVP